ncbi:hypothetical protein BU23DRAFT_634103 [Bimuria novae-zelandiae CBS 107.79]|uniref:AB hydrolase-1 domain-containing protein n=1 Tax=Bimuria novae-zelandiae CBS 107.79 TaxID=1447943 RepID=A0A6A5VD86_9PLEO|nr:hypothetical protein BU23DRAFT_634103 [Bimuria novae-zelandiae CBS 107.79]
MLFYKTNIAVSALTFSSFALSSPASRVEKKVTYPGFVHPSNGDCTDYTTQSTVTYEQFQWNQPRYKNNYEIASLLTRIAAQGKVLLFAFSGSKNVTKEFEIAGTCCKPKDKKSVKQNTTLVATHGPGFDRRPKTTTLPNTPLTPAIPSSITIAWALATLLASPAMTLKPIPRYPELVEAAVLTGYAFPNQTDPAFGASDFSLSIFTSRIVSSLPDSAKPQFAKTFDDGWLSFGDKYAFIESFLGAEDYEVPTSKYTYEITQPYSAVDFLSAFAQPSVADKFEGKILLAPAERDLLFCAGDCRDTFARGLQRDVFPNPKTEIMVYVQEGAGHGQNFAANSRDLYSAIVKFVDSL